ncbi:MULTISPECIES: glycerol-3-phosphate acyltransferase [Ureibacillus]|jgi:glycerol-3-phosphate acyltransferase PlsY|uniref:Glycerol-3-phosphate acyltransferase n=1 Tax=Ureibacillus thermosphaericus TaxID=51173 RepID=A0A840PWZ2_URETH|nr:glycerol-3-phosphate acyltransferase [Ureibacillus thermosphaericus]MBB5150403.1 glycerol-3-phosphate acyltransferase PlsY [Ureibacillus thermosphaericus]NKZ33003.1 glycerol-3-phosphate acyltransferase [Ureibacillus thermosphaericus]
MITAVITFLIVGYFIGCIHGSNAAQLLSGVNLKEAGLGNAGASNATLTLGWKYGILVGFIDIGKGVFAIILTRYFLDHYTLFETEQISILLYLTGAAVILGHNFPIHMHFRGGKGTASLIGIFLAINWKFGLLSMIALVIVSLLSNYLIIGVFFLYIVFAINSLLFEPTIWPFIIVILLLLVATILHLENIKRIKLGTEPTINAAFKREKDETA